MRATNYNQLPQHLRDGMQMYVEEGIPPGGFCMAVLSNDLKGAFGRADETNIKRMHDIVLWLYNECPSTAQGSPQAVKAWIERGGLKGKQARATAA